MSKKERLSILEDQMEHSIEQVRQINEILEGHETTLNELIDKKPAPQKESKLLGHRIDSLTSFVEERTAMINTLKNMLTEFSVNHENMRKAHEAIKTDIVSLFERTGELFAKLDQLVPEVRLFKVEIDGIKKRKKRPGKPINPAKKKRK